MPISESLAVVLVARFYDPSQLLRLLAGNIRIRTIVMDLCDLTLIEEKRRRDIGSRPLECAGGTMIVRGHTHMMVAIDAPQKERICGDTLKGGL